MRRLIPLLVFGLLALALWFLILSPLGDMFARDRFARNAQAYLDRVEPRIVHSTMEWAERENCLHEHDGPSLKQKLLDFKPEPHSKLFRHSGDWVVLHYEIKQAMQNCARSRAESDHGVDCVRMEPSLIREYLPKDWARREQLFEAHLRLSRSWDRPSKPLTWLKSEYKDMKKKLEEFMRDLDIE